jgi:hypothetical protein
MVHELTTQSKKNKGADPAFLDPSASSTSMANANVPPARMLSKSEFEAVVRSVNEAAQDAITGIDAESGEVKLYSKAEDPRVYFQIGNVNSGILLDGARFQKERQKWQPTGKAAALHVQKAIPDGVIFESSKVVVMGCHGEELRSYLGQLLQVLQSSESAKAKDKGSSATSPPKFEKFKMIVRMLERISYEDKEECHVRDKFIELWNGTYVFIINALAQEIQAYSKGCLVARNSGYQSSWSLLAARTRGGMDYTHLVQQLKQYSQQLWDYKYFKTPKNLDTQRKVRIRLIWARLKTKEYNFPFLRDAKSELDDWLKLGKNIERKDDVGECVDYASCVALVDYALSEPMSIELQLETDTVGQSGGDERYAEPLSVELSEQSESSLGVAFPVKNTFIDYPLPTKPQIGRVKTW